MDRRSFQRATLVTASAIGLCRPLVGNKLFGSLEESRKFTVDLCPSRIGVGVDQNRSIELASRYGFESVEPFAQHLARLDDNQLAQTMELLKEKQLKWGAAGLTVDFRKDQATFDTGLKELMLVARALQKAKVDRIGTWISPSHDELTYIQNFRQHAKRLGAIAEVLSDHGIRFGLEYVGPKTSWTSKRHPFIHTMAETLDLISDIAKANVGIVLDSWHWYTAGETLDTLKKLSNEQIVAVDLNDAPAGLERDQQIDSRRELPAATGVIDIKTFIKFLVDVGYDGPVRAEPFNKPLNEMQDAAAVEATSTAMFKAVSADS